MILAHDYDLVRSEVEIFFAPIRRGKNYACGEHLWVLPGGRYELSFEANAALIKDILLAFRGKLPVSRVHHGYEDIAAQVGKHSYKTDWAEWYLMVVERLRQVLACHANIPNLIWIVECAKPRLVWEGSPADHVTATSRSCRNRVSWAWFRETWPKLGLEARPDLFADLAHKEPSQLTVRDQEILAGYRVIDFEANIDALTHYLTRVTEGGSAAHLPPGIQWRADRIAEDIQRYRDSVGQIQSNFPDAPNLDLPELRYLNGLSGQFGRDVHISDKSWLLDRS